MRALSREEGFTMVELMLAVFVCCIGVVSLVGTLDMSRRVTSLAEMKEAASHVAEQASEELRATRYQQLALSGTPAASAIPDDPAFHVGGNGTTYRWNQKSGAPTPHTEPLVICPAVSASCPSIGRVSAAPTTWSDGRLKGKVHRYVTSADTTTCPDGTPCRKRITVAVTVENAGGPKNPILVSTVVANPAPVTGSNNPLEAPSTKCIVDGQLEQCANSISGKVHTFYLHDTPATSSTRQEVAGNHQTRPTVAPTGTCNSTTNTGCPVPDLMGTDAPTGTAPPLYSYSSEITGGTWPGGAVIRRDTTCDGTPTSTDNTKGHLWVTAPLSAPMTLTGQAGLNLSTATFNGVAAQVTICVRFYNVPGSIANLVTAPPVSIGSASHAQASWPQAATMLGSSLNFRSGQGNYTIPAGSRLGMRIWVSSSSAADIAAIYDHVLHNSCVQVNEAASS